MLKILKKYWVDIVVVIAILIAGLTSFLVVKSCNKKTNLIANIYRENEIVLTLDLSKQTSEETVTIDGVKTPMVIAYRHNEICVKESGCPHQDCVSMHWVSDPSMPIICAYNKVSIVLKGSSNNDVVVG